MKSIYIYGMYFFLLLSSIYNVKYKVFPSFLSFKLLLSLVGLFFFLKKKDFVSSRFVKLNSFYGVWFMILLSMTLFVNNVYDYWFTIHLLQFVIDYFVAYALVSVALSYRFSLMKILYLYVLCVLFNNCIALSGQIFDFIKQFIIDIQYPYVEKERLDMMLDFNVRSIGFGTGVYFLGGVHTVVASFIIVYLIKKRDIAYFKGLVILTSLILCGVFIARTSLLGFIALLLLIPNPRNISEMIKFMSLLFFSIIFFPCIILIMKNISLIDTSWAFELIDNFIETGSFTSNSSTATLQMFIMPDNLTNILFGIGRFNGGLDWFMECDIGYLRVLFYGGILMMILYYSYPLVFIHYLLNDKNKLIIYYLCIPFFILNIKGFVNINLLMYIVYIYQINTNNNAFAFYNTRINKWRG